MKKIQLSRQSYIVVWCIMLLCILISCNEKQIINYPEAEKICQKYTDQYLSKIEDIENDELQKKLHQAYVGCLINGEDTVNYLFRIEKTIPFERTVYIKGDDSTSVIYKEIIKDCDLQICSLIEIDNGDTIFNYPTHQKELHDYMVHAYIRPVYGTHESQGIYQLTTRWLTSVSQDEIYISHIDKTTSVYDQRITSISAKISKNGELIECNDHEMGHWNKGTKWMKRDPYYAKKVNKEIKKVLKSL